MSRLQSLRLAAALEVCPDQLDILGHIQTVQISREHEPAVEKTEPIRLRRDCQYVSQQVSELHLEMEEEQSFSSLQQVVEEKEQKKKAEHMRREAKRELEERKQTLQRQQEEFRANIHQLHERRILIKNLKYQEGHLSLKIDNEMVEKHLELELQLTQKEVSQTEKLQEERQELQHKQLGEEEIKVCEGSKKFLQNQHEKLQKQLQEWQQHSNQTVQEKELQLNSLYRLKTVNLDRLTDMRRKSRAMEQVVEEDRVEQEVLRQQQAEIRAATKLQAWWRGCMIRRGLGSFKKEEDKKGKKKKKEGKKKKK
ncbi:dynein regulatory complex protein 9 [Larimichthys crocea]|uniref:dynein regulatory complex protein 9 n=1 Tax=Larimichthys crocea TaxID=215358 RepID=UPI000F5EED78|nr:dynein regulatory complex protein 9 [Larimichthys crocea]